MKGKGWDKEKSKKGLRKERESKVEGWDEENNQERTKQGKGNEGRRME